MNTAPAANAVFSHRHNADLTFDSICHSCFRTIATETEEAALAAHERLHNCVTFAQQRIALLDDPLLATGTAG